MKRIAMGSILAVASILTVGATAAWPANTYTAAPVPSQIIKGKKVFISNDGGLCEKFTNWGKMAENFSGGQDRAYNEFYDAMAKWDHYQLTAVPGDADLDFGIEFVCTTTPEGSVSVYLSDLRLVIRDVKTRMVLWTADEPVYDATTQHGRDKNFEASMRKLVDDVKTLANGAQRTLPSN